jgi:hypothetical protein
MDSIFFFMDVQFGFKVPIGSLLYIKVWVDLLLTSSINVDVSSGPASAATGAAAEPTYTFSSDLRQSVPSTAAVDIKSSQWSSLERILGEDVVFEV